jgi:hypothetical protein
LREVYNANIDCYANVHAYPGTYIYVEPKGWAPQSDSDVDLTQLGLGGYYMIITAENNFGPGQADTKIVAKWVASKDGAKNPMLGPAIASKCRQKAEAASSMTSGQAADGYEPVYFEGTVEEPPPEAQEGGFWSDLWSQLGDAAEAMKDHDREMQRQKYGE